MMTLLGSAGGLRIQDGSVADIAAAENFAELAAEYTDEGAIAGMPAPAARLENYLPLERGGLLHTILATKGNRLIGFILVLASVLPHYGVPVAVSESFFVARAHRRTGAGLRLLNAAEDKARELGASGLLVSAPVRGDLFKVLPRRGYAETSRIFFKRVANG